MAYCMRIPGGGTTHMLEAPIKPVNQPEKKEKPKVDWFGIAKDFFTDGRARETRLELSEELGVNVYSLESLMVGRGYDDYRGLEFSSWPERNHKGQVVGIIRRYKEPVSDDGNNKLLMKGSTHGVYYHTNWWVYGGPILIVEGGSDTAACYSMGISAIGRFSCLGGAGDIKELLYQYRGKIQGKTPAPVVTVGENDWRKPKNQELHKAGCTCCMMCFPGKYGAKEFAKTIKSKWCMTPGKQKDIRDWVNKNGLDRIEFIKQLRREFSMRSL